MTLAYVVNDEIPTSFEIISEQFKIEISKRQIYVKDIQRVDCNLRYRGKARKKRRRKEKGKGKWKDWMAEVVYRVAISRWGRLFRNTRRTRRNGRVIRESKETQRRVEKEREWVREREREACSLWTLFLRVCISKDVCECRTNVEENKHSKWTNAAAEKFANASISRIHRSVPRWMRLWITNDPSGEHSARNFRENIREGEWDASRIFHANLFALFHLSCEARVRIPFLALKISRLQELYQFFVAQQKWRFRGFVSSRSHNSRVNQDESFLLAVRPEIKLLANSRCNRCFSWTAGNETHVSLLAPVQSRRTISFRGEEWPDSRSINFTLEARTWRFFSRNTVYLSDAPTNHYCD